MPQPAWKLTTTHPTTYKASTAQGSDPGWSLMPPKSSKAKMIKSEYCWNVFWLNKWLAWLTGYLIAWLIDWLTDWLIAWLIDWLVWWRQIFKGGITIDQRNQLANQPINQPANQPTNQIKTMHATKQIKDMHLKRKVKRHLCFWARLNKRRSTKDEIHVPIALGAFRDKEKEINNCEQHETCDGVWIARFKCACWNVSRAAVL